MRTVTDILRKIHVTALAIVKDDKIGQSTLVLYLYDVMHIPHGIIPGKAYATPHVAALPAVWLPCCHATLLFLDGALTIPSNPSMETSSSKSGQCIPYPEGEISEVSLSISEVFSISASATAKKNLYRDRNCNSEKPMMPSAKRQTDLTAIFHFPDKNRRPMTAWPRERQPSPLGSRAWVRS